MLTVSQLQFIASSEEFQTILDKDQYLNTLIADSSDNSAEEYFNVMEALGCMLTIGGHDIQPITPAMWSFLWVTGNNYTRDISKITSADTDIFLYLLQNGIRNINIYATDLAGQCAGTVETMGLSYSEAAAELLELIYYTFRPLELLHLNRENEEISSYDVSWLIWLSKIVSKQTGLTFREIVFETPLSFCLYNLVVFNASTNPNAVIFRRKRKDKCREISTRMLHLAEIFCVQNGVK